MKDSPIDELLREYFRLLRAGRRIEKFEFSRLQSTWVAHLTEGDRKGSVRLARDFSHPDGDILQIDLDSLVENTKVDKNALFSAIKAVCRKKTYSDSDVRKLLTPITDRRAAIEAEARDVPNSLGKARSYLINTAVELLDIDAVNSSYGNLPDEDQIVRILLDELHNGGIERPPRGYETEWSVSWYKFLSRFGSGESKAILFIHEAELNIRRSINEITSDIRESILNRSHHNAFSGSFLVWNISRCGKLFGVLQAELTALIDLISKLQGTDGSWSIPKWAQGNQDSTCEVTALCLLALASSHNRSRYDEHMSKAATWLCAGQRDDGGWTSSGSRYSSEESDFLTTALAREALAISTLEFSRNVDRAGFFLIEQQQPMGNWSHQHFSDEFVTAISVECLEAEWPDILPQFANEHLRMARELLPRGQRLLTSGDPSDFRLGIVSLYHGLEAFLYGCFVQSRLDIPIWRKGQTIGLRDALAAYSERKLNGTSNASIAYEQQIRHLASWRDAVVHRSAEVTQNAAREAIRDATSFVRAHAPELLPPGVTAASIWPGMND